MKTLVIHPKDHSTDFLSTIYEDKPSWHIINLDVSNKILKNEISRHDRIIIMGHGTPMGLLGYGRYVITPKFVYLLRDLNKKYVFIWCNANKFIEKYYLHGFYTGMIISEMREAYYCGIRTTNAEINFSNFLFADSIKKSIDLDDFYKNVILYYDNYIQFNPIILFNKKNIYER